MKSKPAEISKIKRILLSGGRSSFAVDFARFFAKAGHLVFVADSWDRHLCSASKHVEKIFQVASPNQNLAKYERDLLKVIDDEQITHLIPVSEEVFFLAALLPELSKKVEVVCAPLSILAKLHHKGEFNRLAADLGLPAPTTRVLDSKERLEAEVFLWKQNGKAFVLKPAFSRFAARTIFSWNSKFESQWKTANPSVQEPWLIQERIVGRELCSYSVAKNGKLLAHVCYSHEFTAGEGAGVCFEAVPHPAIEYWVKHLVSSLQFTGQIAFDFILDEQRGAPYVLECNPRATSGVHLFSKVESFCDVFLSDGGDRNLVTPPPGTLGMTSFLALIIFGIPQINSLKRMKEWLRVMVFARDVLSQASDFGPFVEQFRVLNRLSKESKKSGTSILECSTQDIEWNGGLIANSSQFHPS